MKTINKIYWKCYSKFFFYTSLICPSLATKILFKERLGYKLNLKNPITFNEKIQWLKLNDYYNNELITICADKYKVREYVKKCGCEEILIGLIGAYDSFEEIDWSNLPEKFAMKCNHGCGYNLICTDKRKLDYFQVKDMIDTWMKEDYWRKRAEVNYKYIPKKIVVEEYISSGLGGLPDDYKFYCFNGCVKYILVCRERTKKHAKYYFMNPEWNLLPYSKDSLDKIGREDFSIPKPKLLDKAIKYAENLSKSFPFVRTDLYLLDDKILFGELTFTPAGGMDDDLLDGDIVFGKELNLTI